MENIQKLLDQVAVISEKNAEILDASGGRFNIFKICGVNHYENTHSTIIAEFLNPKGTHGLKAKFLKSFIKMFCDKTLKQIFDCENACVVTERSTNDGRIDILVEDRKNHAIIIENKIYAGDQEEQLKRYDNFAKKEYSKGNYQIIYLTLWGVDASEQSAKGIEYKRISYNTNIIAWLEECVCIAARFSMVRETIIQYINHIKSLTNQDMDTKNKEEIIKLLCESAKNVESAFLISENLNFIKIPIVNKIFLPQLSTVCEELSKDKDFGEEIKNETEEQDWSKKHSCFRVIIPKCKYFAIDFIFWKDGVRDLSVGVWYEKKEGKRYEDTLKKLRHYFEFTERIPQRMWNIFPEHRDWSKEAMLAIYNGKMAEIFKDEIKKILELSKDFTQAKMAN